MKVLCCSVAAMLMTCGTVCGQTWSDDFNRPDGPIGPSWIPTPTTAVWQVISNRGRHTNTGVNDIIRHVDATGSYVDAVCMLDVFCPTTASQFSAIMIGLGGTDSIMVKIQNQTTVPGFSHIGLYHRISATGWGAWTGVGTGTGFQVLTAPFEQGRLKVYFSDPDTIVAEIDTDFDGNPDQTYTRTGVLGIAANLGTGFGIGAWQAAAEFDNWSVTIGGACYANCDASTTAPVLNVADFSCFLQKFAGGDPYANCDGSTTEPVLNVADFSCFLQKFAGGC